jgi:hypothetical protein
VLNGRRGPRDECGAGKFSLAPRGGERWRDCRPGPDGIFDWNGDRMPSLYAKAH